MDPLPFTKMQGIGNDFVIIDGRSYPCIDWSALSSELCDRYRGIGADGLLVLDTSNIADIVMRMYNPDGTPDVCGNGLRCLVRYAIDRDIVQQDTITVVTLAGIREAAANRNPDGNISEVRVAMGAPKFDPASVPIRITGLEAYDFPLDLGQSRELVVTALSTGSTHAVTFVDELPDDERFFEYSPLVEHHPRFPERTSLMWCRVMDRDHLMLRVWERGAGETLGCGTGACASAVAAVRHGFCAAGGPVTVTSKGGSLRIEWRPGEQIYMCGPAEYVYEGVYNLGSHPA